MGRNKLKWKCIFITYLVFLNVFTKSLPIYETTLSSLTTTDTVFKNNEVPLIINENPINDPTTISSVDEIDVNNDTKVNTAKNFTQNNLLRHGERPGQTVSQYAVDITDNGNTFRGRAVIDITVTQETREEELKLYVGGLNIQSVSTGVFTIANIQPATFQIDGPNLMIQPPTPGLSYVVVVEYTGTYAVGGRGLHKGTFNGGQGSYVTMNLHPTYARYVFPCVDHQPTAVLGTKFSFKSEEYNNVVANSMLEENSSSEFRSLPGPAHLWGLMAHNFATINIPTAQVLLYGRSVTNQHDQASIAINFYYANMISWTNKPFSEIIFNQDGRLHIVALPDVSVDSHALSTIGIWEPYMFMETTHAVAQRKTALFEIANAMAKQWFGYILYPEHWRHEWVFSGLASYAAYEMMRMFQTGTNDITLLDVNALFVADIIQESLLRDAYTSSQVLLPGDTNVQDEDQIRVHVNGLLKYKAPAILRMISLVLSKPGEDCVRTAVGALLNRTGLQAQGTFHFIDAIDATKDPNSLVGDTAEYFNPWLTTTGYPLLHVSIRPGGVVIMQERFSFATQQGQQNYLIPITYTTSVNPDFSNLRPTLVTDATTTLNFALGEDDYVIFNIQGQGYYRVNYDVDLWERILNALDNPENREKIHPLNRATLIDDALNLARAGRLEYDVALRVALTMQHETEYAVWKAFVRNMDFLKKRLLALVADDDGLDPNIYMRMIRRTITSIENQLGFTYEATVSEPAMTTLTRGLVMEHACKAGYDPCIAAAVDWFYAPNSENAVVNPNIPHEIRPAVYCTMVREGDEKVKEALFARLEIEPTLYERVVILESLACSNDENYVRTLLEETIAQNSPYSVEERNRIFAAVARASNANANVALNFITMRTNEIRNQYGGTERLEEAIHILAECMANDGQSNDFRIWVNAQNNNLDNSQDFALRELSQVNQNLNWNRNNLNNVYNWFDENDASTTALSIFALCISLMVALLNH